MPTLHQYQYDLYQLAVGVLYLNLGRAGVNFPTTTRAHPSYMVQVVLLPGGGALTGDHRKLFPFEVQWGVWQQVVVPLFAEGYSLVKVPAEQNETLRHQINREYLLTGEYAPLLALIQQTLLEGCVAQGFLPAGTTPEGFVAEQVAPGEPVVPVGTDPASPYARID
jgi:hypothetical protein